MRRFTVFTLCMAGLGALMAGWLRYDVRRKQLDSELALLTRSNEALRVEVDRLREAASLKVPSEMVGDFPDERDR